MQTQTGQMQTLLQRHTEIQTTLQKTRQWRHTRLHTHSDTCTQAYVYRHAQRQTDTTESYECMCTPTHMHTHRCPHAGTRGPEDTPREETLVGDKPNHGHYKENGFQHHTQAKSPSLLFARTPTSWVLPLCSFRTGLRPRELPA